MELYEIHGSPGSNQRQTITELREDDAVKRARFVSLNIERSISIKDASRNLDVQQLARIATLPGGFLTDELRRETCTVFRLYWPYKSDDSRANSIEKRLQVANKAI